MNFKNKIKGFFTKIISKIKTKPKIRAIKKVQKKIEKTYDELRTNRLILNDDLRNLYKADEKQLLKKMPKGLTKNEATSTLGRVLQGSIEKIDKEFGSFNKAPNFVKLDPESIKGNGIKDPLKLAKKTLKQLEKRNNLLSDPFARETIATKFYEEEKNDIENFLDEIAHDYYNDSSRINSTLEMKEVIEIIKHNSRNKLIH